MTLSGMYAKEVNRFLNESGLTPDSDADFTVALRNDNDDIVATGSLVGHVLKFIAVSPSEQGTGACATVVSELVSYAYREQIYKLFVFTKPQNEVMFSSLGFYPLAKVDGAMMMENERDGLAKYLKGLSRPETNENIGAIVANCNPMTNGHLWLIKEAASKCNALHLFILSEEKSKFSAKARYDIVKKEVEGIDNVYLHSGGDYIISSATFPTYFMKDKASTADINADLDLTLFGDKIARELNITKRFVGTEPYCGVTNRYNERMKVILPKYGVEVVELERMGGISASKVRELMMKRELDKIREIVPKATFDYISSHIDELADS